MRHDEAPAGVTGDFVEPSASEHWSVRTYLALILVTALVAIAAGSCYGFFWSARQARSSTITSLNYSTSQAVASMSSALETARTTVDGLTQQPGIGDVFVTDQDCQLNASGDDAFPSVRIDIVATNGRIACSSDPEVVNTSRLHAESDWLASTMDTSGTTVSWDALDAATNDAAIVVSAPIKSDGKVAGALAVLLHTPDVGRTLAKNRGGARGASFTIVDREDRTVLSSSEGAEIGSRFGGETRTGEWVGGNGTRQVFGSTDLPDSTWRVYAGVDESYVLAQSRGTLLREGLIGLLAMLVLAAGLYLLSRRVGRPLRDLTDAVTAVGHSGKATHVPETGTAEMATLAREFNAMMDVSAGHAAQLVHLASHDALTGLPNIFLLREQIDVALQQAEEIGEVEAVTLLFLGLDRFKVVNDALGHEAGDRILREVARRFSSVVPESDTLARFGGDEFVVLCSGRDRTKTTKIAAELQRCLTEPFTGLDEDIVLQMSVGVSTTTSGTLSSEQLIREAVAAMHHAKATGQNICVYDETLQVRAAYQIQVERDLRRALERDELVVHYQPLTDAVTGGVVGVEALVRWHHPQRGMVPPLEFIPVAETSGQINEIGTFVLTAACAQAAEWSAAGHPLRMSVNVAVGQIHGGGFPELVARVLVETGLPAEQLCLEITESSLMRSGGQITDDLARLRQLGVHLAIDDFGTGYSSLSYLHRLPVDEIKVDRSFISRLGVDDRVRHLVGAILAMAQALDLKVVAEGVETQEQLDYLIDHGCDIAQGYLFSPPRPAEAILTLLAEQRDAAGTSA